MSTHPKVQLPRTCLLCHTKLTISVPLDEYLCWTQGALAQDALTSLTTDEREILITSICGTCFDSMEEDEG